MAGPLKSACLLPIISLSLVPLVPDRPTRPQNSAFNIHHFPPPPFLLSNSQPAAAATAAAMPAQRGHLPGR